MLCQCEVTHSVMHLKDATSTRTGYLSKRGKYLLYSARHKYLKGKGAKYFFLYLFPYILVLIAVLLLLPALMSGTKINPMDSGGPSGVLLSVASVFFLVSTVIYLRKKELFRDIGSPEKTIHEVSGYIDLDTGYISASSNTYDTYSEEQEVKIAVNIILFLIAWPIFTVTSWIIYVVYLIRRTSFKKLANEGLHDFDKMTDFEKTMYFACDSNLEPEPDDITLPDENGEAIDDPMAFMCTFFSGDSIYALFHRAEDDNALLIYEVLPGYKPRLITDDEEFKNVVDLGKKIQEESEKQEED